MLTAALAGTPAPPLPERGARGSQAAPGHVEPLILRLAAERLPLRDVPVTAPVATIGRATACTANATPGLQCSTLSVPLDRSGAVGGTIPLRIETLPAPEPRRGVMFLIAGGPGQGSAASFGLDSPNAAAYYRFLFPGYTLVAFDNRGTGESGFLDCPGIDGYYEPDAEQQLVASCAGSIGPGRVFYGTDEHVEDLEAVRVALGAEKVGLWGTSYGTKLAGAYAFAYPGRVERLLLDSVLPPDENDPFRTKSSRAIPPAIASLCAGGACARATRNAVADLSRLANQMAAKPISDKVTRANGRTRTVRMRGVELLSLVLEADLSPGIAAALPAAVRAALAGNSQPLLRLYDLITSEGAGRDISAGLFASTVCADGPFPWTNDAAPAARRAAIDAAVGRLGAGAFAPFGTWAAKLGNAEFCLGWPAPTGNPWLGAGPLPDVPVLALNGGFDMRTPPPGAQNMVARFRQGRLIVVPGVGHSVLGADSSFCAARATRAWMLGESFSDQCARPADFVRPIPVYPAPLGKRIAAPAQTFAIASSAVLEAQAMWLLSFGSNATIAGVAGGRVVVDGDGFRLVRYSPVPGVAVSGRVRLRDVGPPLVFEGVVTVSGKAAATGLLGFTDGKLGGTLGGTLVGG